MPRDAALGWAHNAAAGPLQREGRLKVDWGVWKVG